MAYSTVPKTKRDGKITLQDGGAVTLEVAYEDGNLSYEQPTAQSSLPIFDRGTLSAVRKQDDQFITFTFSANMRQFTDAAAGSINDFVRKVGFYNGNASAGTGTPYIEQYVINVQFEVEGTDLGDLVDSSATFSKCECTSVSFSEGDPNSFSLSFTCYGGVVFATAP
tara:strand:- start:158 stop:658 length:501 start_codon:yes stop_codon:yes gene_type:complete